MFVAMTPFDGKTIGRRVAAYRRLNGWTMDELADRTGGAIGRSVIANIETGRKQDITVSQLVVLASGLGLPVVALLTDIGTMRDQSESVGSVSRLTGVTNPAPDNPAALHVSEVLAAYRELVEREKEMQMTSRYLDDLRAKKSNSRRSPDDPRTDDDRVFEYMYNAMNRGFQARRLALETMESAAKRLAAALGETPNEKEPRGTPTHATE